MSIEETPICPYSIESVVEAVNEEESFVVVAPQAVVPPVDNELKLIVDEVPVEKLPQLPLGTAFFKGIRKAYSNPETFQEKMDENMKVFGVAKGWLYSLLDWKTDINKKEFVPSRFKCAVGSVAFDIPWSEKMNFYNECMIRGTDLE